MYFICSLMIFLLWYASFKVFGVFCCRSGSEVEEVSREFCEGTINLACVYITTNVVRYNRPAILLAGSRKGERCILQSISGEDHSQWLAAIEQAKINVLYDINTVLPHQHGGYSGTTYVEPSAPPLQAQYPEQYSYNNKPLVPGNRGSDCPPPSYSEVGARSAKQFLEF